MVNPSSILISKAELIQFYGKMGFPTLCSEALSKLATFFPANAATTHLSEEYPAAHLPSAHVSACSSFKKSFFPPFFFSL